MGAKNSVRWEGLKTKKVKIIFSVMISHKGCVIDAELSNLCIHTPFIRKNLNSIQSSLFVNHSCINMGMVMNFGCCEDVREVPNVWLSRSDVRGSV